MKAGILAPLYLSVSWVLTVSYQLLTETAVRAIGTNIGLLNLNASHWITSNIQVIVFVYAFTWIFVLSSVIPQVILGNKGSILGQYAIVLTLSLIALFMPDMLLSFAGIDVRAVDNYVPFLRNPLIAGVYLVLPYLFMLSLDLRSRNFIRNRKMKELTEELKIARAKQNSVGRR